MKTLICGGHVIDPVNRVDGKLNLLVENGKIVDDFFTLVDPEVHFDAFNIRLTGISEEIVEGAPTFPQLWKAIAPLMESGLQPLADAVLLQKYLFPQR